jgi:hypothetical protein
LPHMNTALLWASCCWRQDRERLERKHRCRDLTSERIGDRGRGPFEHEQPRTGDLARECFAVADWEPSPPEGE